MYEFIICIIIFLIGFVILNYHLNKREKEISVELNDSVIVDNEDKLRHVLNTAYGRFGVEGNIVFDNPVSIEEINGQYGIIRVETQHYENVGTKDNSRYEWVPKNYKDITSDTFTLLGSQLNTKDFNFEHLRVEKEIFISKTEKEVYYVVPIETFISFYAYSDVNGLMNIDNKMNKVDISFLLLEETKMIQESPKISRSQINTAYIFFSLFFSPFIIGILRTLINK